MSDYYFVSSRFPQSAGEKLAILTELSEERCRRRCVDKMKTGHTGVAEQTGFRRPDKYSVTISSDCGNELRVYMKSREFLGQLSEGQLLKASMQLYICTYDLLCYEDVSCCMGQLISML